MPPANWYPDPHNPAQLRWWDGGRWTLQVAARALPAGAAVSGPAAHFATPPAHRRLPRAALVVIILLGAAVLLALGAIILIMLMDAMVQGTGFDEVMCGTSGNC